MSQPPYSGDWPDPSSPPPTTPGWGAGQPGQPAYPPGAYQTPSGPPGYGYPGYGYPQAAPTNGLAIAALVCSLAGLITCLSAPVGAILGHVARKQIRERGEQGDGMALAGIIVGWVLTGLGLVGCVIYIAVIGWAISLDSGSSY
jgi:Domain of unknown function (DUF4190)